MNHKKRTSSQSAILIAVIGAMLLVGLGIGYQIGINRSKQPATAATPAPLASPKQALPSSPAPENTPAKGLSPEQLAAAKGLPATLSDPTGDYKLIAVIEGTDANRKLTSRLQVVGSQRQRLLSLSRQYDQTPASSLQQRELIAGEILQARRTLTQNLEHMAKNYGYSLNFNYRLIPHAASLLLISSAGDTTPSSTLAHQFENAASYEHFQKLRDEYLLLGLKQSSAPPANPAIPTLPAPDTPDESTVVPPPVTESNSPTETEARESNQPDQAPASLPAAAKPSADMLALKAKLMEQYNYDPTKNHQLNFEKTALYARPGQQ